MVGRGAGGALYQWLIEGLVVPCSNGWERGWWCPVPMVGIGAGGALYQWLIKRVGVAVHQWLVERVGVSLY